jgi:hypothetical protein
MPAVTAELAEVAELVVTQTAELAVSPTEVAAATLMVATADPGATVAKAAMI